MSRALVSGNRMHAKVCFIQIQLHTYKSMVPRTWTSNPQKYVAWEAQGYFMTWLGIFVHFLAENYLIKSQCGMFLLLCCLHFFWCRSQPWPHTQQEAAGQWQCRQESRAGCHCIPALVLLPTPGALWLWGGGCSHGKVFRRGYGERATGCSTPGGREPHLQDNSLKLSHFSGWELRQSRQWRKSLRPRDGRAQVSQPRGIPLCWAAPRPWWYLLHKGRHKLSAP